MYRRFIVTCFMAGGLAVATSVATTTVIAQEAKPTKPSDSSSTSDQNQHDSKKAVDAQIDKLSKQVDLTSDQKDQLRAQMEKGNGKTQKLWSQFANAHVQVIRQEAEMLAALEDVMEPEQKQKAQQNRQSKANASNVKDSQHADAKKNQHAKDQASKDPATKDKQSADKPASSAASDSKSKTKDAATAKAGQNDVKNGSDKSRAAEKSDNQQQTEEYVWTMVIVPAQVELAPLGLSGEQQQQCDQVCRNYHHSLVQGWQKIDQLHDQLVAMEAQQIIDVEKILTDAQRQKLMNSRRDSNKKDSANNSKTKG